MQVKQGARKAVVRQSRRNGGAGVLPPLFDWEAARAAQSPRGGRARKNHRLTIELPFTETDILLTSY
jgi:hypothetical protein